MMCACLVAFSVASCSGTPGASSEDDFSSKVNEFTIEAQNEGASDAQLALLDQIAAEGKVDIEMQRAAIRSALSCMEQGGLDVTYIEQPNGSGLLVPGYIASGNEQLGEQGTLDVIDECDTGEARWVSGLYQTQPTSQEQKEAYLDALIPQMSTCLIAAGYSVADDATGTDLQVQIARAEADTGQNLGCFAGDNGLSDSE